MKPELRRYSEVRNVMRDGDLLLFRRRGLISIAGRGEHSHAGKAAWWGDDLFLLEVLQFHGGRAVTLSSQVSRRPGRWDVYAANPDGKWPEYDAAGSTKFMRRLCGTPYGYWGVAKAAMFHLPFVKLLVRPETDDDLNGSRPPFCSMACALADRVGGGVDPVPGLSDRITEPADLARSPFYRYVFTLTWDEQETAKEVSQ